MSIYPHMNVHRHPLKMRFSAANLHLCGRRHFYKQSIELSGNKPRGGALPGINDGGSIEFEEGSTFSESSIRSAQPSQLIWNLVTRGFDARIFLWSWDRNKHFINYDYATCILLLSVQKMFYLNIPVYWNWPVYNLVWLVDFHEGLGLYIHCSHSSQCG